MHSSHRHFIPAAGLHAALPLYDPLLRLIGASAAQRAFVARAQLRAGQRVLEIGCGTGNVLRLALEACPGAELVGLDPDARALSVARAKLARAGLRARLDQGFADALPYADASFEVVLSSFMWHHLSPDVQRTTLQQLRRVLVPGGSLHLIDFVSGSGWLRMAHAQPSEALRAALVDAGFRVSSTQERARVLWQHVCHYHATY